MEARDTRRQIKQLLVSELNLRNRDPETIGDDDLLFGKDGLGLDSLDALQIAMIVEEQFGVRVPEGDEARPIFRSVSTLAEFVDERSEATRGGPSGSGGERSREGS